MQAHQLQRRHLGRGRSRRPLRRLQRRRRRGPALGRRQRAHRPEPAQGTLLRPRPARQVPRLQQGAAARRRGLHRRQALPRGRHRPGRPENAAARRDADQPRRRHRPGRRPRQRQGTDRRRPARGADADAAKLDLQLDLASDPRLVPGQKNQVEVVAYNAEGYLSSRGMVSATSTAPARPPTDPPDAVRRRRRRLELRGEPSSTCATPPRTPRTSPPPSSSPASASSAPTRSTSPC